MSTITPNDLELQTTRDLVTRSPDLAQIPAEIEKKMEEIADNVANELESEMASTNSASQDSRAVLTQLPEDPTYIMHEEKYVQLWNLETSSQNDLYSKMVHKNHSCPKFDFMDGPPFVSGNLHPGHIAVGSFKSALFNYKIMDGYLCEVRPGYDCHGLPALNKTADENKLTIEQFKALPIAESNSLCEKMIFKYKNSWKPLIQRIGRLVDFENDYMTRNPEFMESCWWVFKQIYDQGNVYKGEKVMPYSYGNQTPLSNFEASQNYKEKDTKSIYVGFEVKNSDVAQVDEKTYLVAWTTTPWTLPANRALCVNADSVYTRFKVHNDKKPDNNIYIMAKNSVQNLFDAKVKIDVLNEIKGSELVGTEYVPIYPFMNTVDASSADSYEYKVLADSYVTDKGVGSGVVHLAPAFGEDDFRVCSANGLVSNTTVSRYCPIDEYGRFTECVEPYKGRLVFECEDDIRDELKKRGVLYKTQQYKHNYPYCWRTNTPLIYRATPSYYIRATAYRDRMLELNSTVSWTPREIGENRFQQWLKDIKDWSVSRSTSYATPIPIWRSEDGSELCVGSIDELEKLSGVRVSNLHPEFVNDIIIQKDGMSYKRVTDTFDCWFESGAVPMAQKHYPFNSESKELETREFMSDFICEGMDQTRGWFYTLMVLSTAIFNKAPYRNVLCTGMILDKNGDKFSKKLGNYVDPMESIAEFGADVIRVYFINSPVMNADCLKFNEEHIKKLKRRFTPYINGVKFWIEHTLNHLKQNGQDTIDLSPATPENKKRVLTNLFDKWIVTRTNELIGSVRGFAEEYRFGSAIEKLLDFIEDLTNWYIKFNRDRLKGLETADDWSDSIYVLYNVLMTYCRLWAPFTPFMSEHIFQHLKGCSSEFAGTEYVLLAEYPKLPENYAQDVQTLTMFKDLQRICSLVRNLRDGTSVHTKMVVPLKKCTIYHDDENYLGILKQNIHLVQTELNCLEFVFEHLQSNTKIVLTVDRKAVGQGFRKESGAVTKLLESLTPDQLSDLYDGRLQLKFKAESSTEDVLIDKQYYKLSKTPLNSVTTENVSCDIDSDLMVSIDHTYNDEIHGLYQEKRLHTAVQNIRKQMGLRPWNEVSVIIDNNYATPQLKSALEEKLTNAVVMIGDFNDNSLYSTLTGLHETENHKLFSEEFVVEGFNGAPDVKGKIVVYYAKPK